MLKQLFNALKLNIRPAQMQSSKHDVKQVLEAVSGFTNPLTSSVEDNEL